MWSSRPMIGRRLALLGLAFGLAGCGFVPAYGTGGAMADLIGQVDVSAPDTVAGFRLADRLRARLGPADTAPLFRLDVSLDLSETGVAVTQEGAITRITLVGVARFRLVRVGDGSEVLTGDVDNFTSYSTTDSTVATENARTDAEARLARILADQIVTRLQNGTA